MNIESILKECEELRHRQSHQSKNKTYPHIVSQDSLEKIMQYSSAPSHYTIAGTITSDADKAPAKLVLAASMSIDTDESRGTIEKEDVTDFRVQKTNSFDSVDSNSNSGSPHSPSNRAKSFDEAGVKSASAVQQTSVITSIRQRPTDKTRLKSFQRQKSIDETMQGDDMEVSSSPSTSSSATLSQSVSSDKNNNTERKQTAPRTVTEHSIAYFLDDNHASRGKSKIIKSASQQETPSPVYDRARYNSLKTNSAKSKSLDLIESEYNPEYPPQPHSFPIRFPHHSALSFEAEEQGARYINALHISPPYGHSSFPNSPCGSPIDNSIRHSPVQGGGPSVLRRLQQQERHLISDSPSMVPTQVPLLFGGRARSHEHPSHIQGHITKSRSYDLQLQRQYRFTQKKAYSLATAPYDIHEKNLRRIFSEENVPDNLIGKAMSKQYPNMRRAASYDLISRYSSSNGNSPTRQTSDPSYLRQQAAVKSTKIIFPEHDNVTDCNSIFTQPVEDERAHALKINKIMERSFNSITDNNIPPYHTPRGLQSSPSFDELEKNGKKNDPTGTPSKQTKILVHQNSADKNYTIGPYKYDAEVDDEVAVCVSGLLTLPGSNEKKYPISVGELRRRIAPPEFLNKVDMISYVRLAKTSARELLEKHAIRPKHHSRKSKHSVISKMCEAECAELANGVKMLSEVYFPKEWLANQVAGSVQEEEEALKRQQLAEMQNKFEITKNVLKDISMLLEAKKSSEEMQSYNLATHSFGALSLNNNIELLTSFLQTQTDVINQRLVNNEFSSRDDNSMETESGISSKNSSIDEPHL